MDLNAGGSERSADSLSGGETFLASLALALALAEMVTRGGGRLDAFFLDEGFGSLDPEHIDRAMDGVGRLVANDEDRLVVLVSHVAEMRDAIEDLIVLDKHDVTGDTIVRSGATPAASIPPPGAPGG
ncbi:MAG: SbcC/MukB-like Walker B domain-containing protein [Actinomycetota bacterium]